MDTVRLEKMVQVLLGVDKMRGEKLGTDIVGLEKMGEVLL